MPVHTCPDRTRKHLREGAGIAIISTGKRTKVLGSRTLIDDRGRGAVPNKKQVCDEAADTPITVSERVDLLERRMKAGEVCKEVLAVSGTLISNA